jgi:gliding motility-associated-like protein
VLQKLTACLLFFLVTFTAYSQVPVFAITQGGMGEDHAHRTTVDNNGNIIVIGRFNGTADFDGGPGVFNLTSNGSSDLFVAKYTSTGTFIWAFRAGGTDRDAAYGVAIDNLNNIYITGYFRGTADFDPGPGSAILTSNGQAGFDPGWSGEIFVAKYSPAGAYAWAFSVGGSTISDDGQEIIVDNSGDVIIAGFFSGQNVDFDPSPTNTFVMGSSTEEMFLAKYTNAGNFVWAKQMGGHAAANETIRQLDVDNADNIYVTGFFTISADFDPGPGTAILSAASTHEGFVARYNSLGDYAWAYQFGGTGFNQGWSIDVDPVNNALYIAGVVQGSSVRFTAANGTTTYGNPGNNDAFFAKYTLNGNLAYVNFLSGGANQEAYDIVVNGGGNCLYVTGYFEGTTDFDPGTAINNLVPNGAKDAFLGKYLLDGSYVWAFKIGGTSDDFGFAVRMADQDIVVNGSFMGSNVDFDPSAAVLSRSSAGNYDGFVARYAENAPTFKFDFTYKQDVCNPLSVQFSGVGTNLQGPYWSFGDGNTSTSGLQPANVYPSFNNYLVKFSASNGTQRDTVTKLISVGVANADIIVTPDTTICEGGTKQLRTKPALSFCWSPTTYLNDPNLPNPTTSTPQNITYYFTAEVTGNNLIINGDFSAGNTGFSSDYRYTNPTNITEGEYNIGTNPQTWNPGMSNCPDHTTGNGNMMMVNGSGTLNSIVWQQTITVTPNTNYAFSTWLQAVHPTSPAQLQFSINGQPLGNTINASATPCSWNQFYTTWNSGNNTTAVISVVNRNTGVAGNDFALDDISFAPVFIQRDSVRITVDKPVINASKDTAFCPGTSFQLNATGAASYSWSPAAGLSNASIANPVATPAATTQYTVTGTTASGCTAKDSITLTVLPRPTIVKSNDTGICRNATAQLFASGGVSYAWSPAATLSNPNIANPIASPTGYTVYKVLVTDANNCTNEDSVKVSIRPKPSFTISTNKTICEGSTVTLNASGGDLYAWSPASLVDDPSSASPVASPGVTTLFTVHASERVCNYDSTLTVNVTVNETPELQVSKSNDIDCVNAFANLLASGASTYSWSPATGLDNPAKNDPIARVNTSTTYTVTGTNQFGCSSSDTITVKVSNAGNPIFEVPNAFTPNNDRVNDCFGLRKWARVTELEFNIYNRWGQKVFSTNDPSRCWDGTLNGKPQDSGGFVYTIRARSACGEVNKKGVVLLIR